MPEVKRQFYYANYIIKVLREENYYYDESKVRMFIFRNVLTDNDFDKVKYFLKSSNNWSSFRVLMENEFEDNF